MEQLNLENETFLCWSNHQIEFPKTIEERWMMEQQKNLLFLFIWAPTRRSILGSVCLTMGAEKYMMRETFIIS